jgi:hypothetical protein
MDAHGRELARWTFLLTALLTAAAAGAAVALGHVGLAWGLLAGAGLGGLIMGGLLWVVYVVLTPAAGQAAPGRKLGALVFPLINLAALGLLYLLIARWHVSALGLAAGVTAPVLVASGVALVILSRTRRGLSS